MTLVELDIIIHDIVYDNVPETAEQLDELSEKLHTLVEDAIMDYINDNADNSDLLRYQQLY